MPITITLFPPGEASRIYDNIFEWSLEDGVLTFVVGAEDGPKTTAFEIPFLVEEHP